VNFPARLVEEIRLTEPVPVKLIVWGLPTALSVMVITPVRVPVAVGVKVTLIVQFAAAASEAPHVVVRA
jgi:hypothetical protein